MKLIEFVCPKCNFTKVVNLDNESPPRCFRHSLHFDTKEGEITNGIEMINLGFTNEENENEKPVR